MSVQSCAKYRLIFIVAFLVVDVVVGVLSFTRYRLISLFFCCGCCCRNGFIKVIKEFINIYIDC